MTAADKRQAFFLRGGNRESRGLDHVREILAGTSEPPVPKDETHQSEGNEVGETRPVSAVPSIQIVLVSDERSRD